MWGGQFAVGMADTMQRINASIGFDQKMYSQDIAGSIAHATMLAETGILSQLESESIIAGLRTVLEEMESGHFEFKVELEDIHMNVESRLTELIGDVAGKLHTARSRNDQVALDFRLYVRDALHSMDLELLHLLSALLARASEHVETIIPGFTHLQTAQPVTLGHHLMAYVEMVIRDRARIESLLLRMSECPLGAAALAGTSFPIDRHMTAELLEFNRPCANSLDAVSDRDFALEFLSIASISSMHLSRLAEEFVNWSSTPWGFIRFSDMFSTGSSIMPQKRNPDAAELVRGKCGRIAGAWSSLLMTMKGLPLTYNKDMQEDKEPVFEAFEQWRICVQVMAGMVLDFAARPERMRDVAAQGYATATDLADWLVRKLGLPFRQAHHITARVVKLASEQGLELVEMSLVSMQSVEPRITQEVFGVLSVEASVASRTSFGGTSPIRVREAIAAAKAAHNIP